MYFSKNRTAIKVVPQDVTDDVSSEKKSAGSVHGLGLSICLSSGTGCCVQKTVLEPRVHGNMWMLHRIPRDARGICGEQ